MEYKTLYVWLLLSVFGLLVRSLNLTSKELNEATRSASGCNVAFFATKTASGHQGINHVVKFEDVRLNEGYKYSYIDGVFTAPSAGVYVFSATIVTKKEFATLASLYVNGIPLGRLFADDRASVTITVKLIRNDRVFVQINNGHSSYVEGNRWSSFTGHQISC